MQKFEYKVLAVPTKKGWFVTGGNINFEELDAKLNELGADGWEVVSGTGLNRYPGTTENVMIILKRTLPENQ
jgi:hypothetical protein